MKSFPMNGWLLKLLLLRDPIEMFFIFITAAIQTQDLEQANPQGRCFNALVSRTRLPQLILYCLRVLLGCYITKEKT